MWRKTRKAVAARNDLSAFIDEGSEIEGKYTFSGTVMLNGKFHGEIASADTLIIGGELVGNVVASDRVELKEGARVFGDVEAPVVVVAEGVLFDGHCRMTSAKPAGSTPADSTLVALKR